MINNFRNDIIEQVLQTHQAAIGRDYARYRNHVYRVYLNCLLIDSDRSNEPKYAIAAVFHDIGLWTANTLDYLAPSIEQARKYLGEDGNSMWEEEISTMINWHHKISAYRKDFSRTTETFRKADWIDVSLGLLKFGCSKKAIKEINVIFPNLGFHRFLIKRIFKNLFIRPLKPLPMFRR